VFPNHPESEFVPNFLKEAMSALKEAEEMNANDKLPF